MRVPCHCVSLPVTLNFISLYVTLTFGRSVQSVKSSENPGLNELNNEAVNVYTYHIGNSDKGKIQQMETIVDSLEKLGVLDPTQKNCYTVDKIVKSLQMEGDSTYRVGIYFYIKESNNDKDNKQKDTSLSPQEQSSSRDFSSNSSSELSSSSSNNTEGW